MSPSLLALAAVATLAAPPQHCRLALEGGPYRISAALAPYKIEATMAFMFESRFPFRPTSFAAQAPFAQPDYDQCWDGFRKAQLPTDKDAA